jgi:hypothetical protein
MLDYNQNYKTIEAKVWRQYTQLKLTKKIKPWENHNLLIHHQLKM